MQTFGFSITLEKVNNQIQASIGSNAIPGTGLGAGDSVELTVTATSGLSAPTIHTIQFFKFHEGQPTAMEAIWARIGQTEGIFTSSGLVFATMQSSPGADEATFTNNNVTEDPQDIFFTCGGFVTDDSSTRSWLLDPEVILRSGEW